MKLISNHFLQKVKYKVQFRISDLLFRTGMGNSLLKNRPGGRILLYHGIDRAGRKDLNTRFISIREFEQHIKHFKEHYHLVSLDDYFKGQFADDRLTLAITFDDGYRNNLTNALPVLEKYQVPASFFVTSILDAGHAILWTDFLDLACSQTSEPIVIEGIQYKKKRGEYYHPNGSRLKVICKQKDRDFKEKMLAAFPKSIYFYEDEKLLDYWEQLSQEEIRKLADSPYASIGSHGYFHDNLGIISHKDACTALQKSKSYLENILQKPVNALAYPDGSYTRPLVEYATELGFSQQLAVGYLYNEDQGDGTIRDRFNTNPFISFENQIWSLLRGQY